MPLDVRGPSERYIFDVIDHIFDDYNTLIQDLNSKKVARSIFNEDERFLSYKAIPVLRLIYKSGNLNLLSYFDDKAKIFEDKNLGYSDFQMFNFRNKNETIIPLNGRVLQISEHHVFIGNGLDMNMHAVHL